MASLVIYPRLSSWPSSLVRPRSSHRDPCIPTHTPTAPTGPQRAGRMISNPIGLEVASPVRSLTSLSTPRLLARPPPTAVTGRQEARAPECCESSEAGRFQERLL